MGVKFRMQFENVQGDICVVNFLFNDYQDEPIPIYGGARPFVLSEFNTDQDLFKPVRPQQATIEVLASIAGLDMEDFLTDDDEDIVVRFDFGEYEGYWYGYLSQEDIQETWIAQNHILTLRADDGIGRLKEIPLSDDGARLIGTFTPFQLIQYAMQTPVVPFLRSRVVSNLYHTSMSSASNTTGIEQCTIDARTFETAPGEFEDSYTVLEKINRAWSSTLFQWRGDWFVLRLEELFTDGNLIGFRQNVPVIGQRQGINQRYDISVGVDESVKPVVPEMIKTLQKPSKETTIRYDWDEHVQVACNESFKQGNFIETTGTFPNETDQYEVDLWDYLKTPISTPTAADGTFRRYVVFADNKLQDEYIIISKDNTGVNAFIRSCNVYVSEADEFTFDFQYALLQTMSATKVDAIAFVQLYGNDGTFWTLDEDGEWYQSNSSWTTNFRLLQITWASGEGVDFKSFDSTSTIPRDGYLQFSFYKDSTSPWNSIYFKDFNIDVTPNIQKNRRRPIAGNFDRYTIANDLSKNYDETIYLDDSESGNYKGALKEDDGFTLTEGGWFRRRYNTERYRFKRQHAIARWFMNRSYKAKLDVNLFGLKWDIGGTNYPIGIVNTLKFVDDAPTKIFAITNLREVDFMSCIWSASLVEVYDTTVDEDVPGDTDVHTFDYYYE